MPPAKFNQEDVDRFLRESRSAAQLKHSAIVSLDFHPKLMDFGLAKHGRRFSLALRRGGSVR
jgi:hypothetical protein